MHRFIRTFFVGCCGLMFVGCCVAEAVKKFQNLRCGLPEVVDASSTNSISFTSSPFKQRFKFHCSGEIGAKYRTADGTCNHVLNLGSANTPAKRLLPSLYDDEYGAPRTRSTVTGKLLPSVSDVSRTVHGSSDVPDKFSAMLMQWGQFIDHDMTGFPISSEVDHSIVCCGHNNSIPIYAVQADRPPECFPIILSPSDSRFQGSCLEFARSIAARNEHGQLTFPREQVNALTSFIDGSMVYGSSQELQDYLREGHLMRVNVTNYLLPRNPVQNCNPRSTDYCFLAGDSRVNEQPGLAAIHTVFVHLHNDVARVLRRVRPSHSPDQVFQEARKIVIGVIQNVHYGEWLPLVLGPMNMRKFGLKTGSRKGYVPSLNPSIANAFSTAGFRMGHTFIPPGYLVGDRFHPLRTLFNKPDLVFDNFTAMVRALVQTLNTTSSRVDPFFTKQVTGHLFEPEHLPPGRPSRGLDLVALNIQRGRDHGLPPYNHFREFCGLAPLKSFNEIRPRKLRIDFQKVYHHVDDIDLFSGLMSERRESRKQLVGPTLACLLGSQFHELLYGDRFYFETNRQDAEGFTDYQLEVIRDTTIGNVLCHVRHLESVQERAFEPPGPENPLIKCFVRRLLFMKRIARHWNITGEPWTPIETELHVQ